MSFFYSNNPKLECPIGGPIAYWLREQRAADLASAIDTRATGSAAIFAERLVALGAFALGMAAFTQDVADGVFEVDAINRDHMANGGACSLMAEAARRAGANAGDAARRAQRASDAAYAGDLMRALADASHAVECALWAANAALAALRLAPLTSRERVAASGALWRIGHALGTLAV